MKYSLFILALAAGCNVCLVGNAAALDKEVSLVSKKPIGELAVAGRLSIDLHAEFMVSRTYEKDTVLNWYNCGYSGGGRGTKVGGTFGDFGYQVPFREREEKYPHAVSVGKVRAVRFDGGDFLKGNFAAETKIAGAQNMALEIWLRAENPARGEVILGWQSPDGRAASASVSFPPKFTGSTQWRHIVVNCTSEKEDWYLDGAKVSTGKRSFVIQEGHVLVLGGASSAKPSFKGDLAAVRLHDEAMTEEEVAHNFKSGVMLGTEMHNWWRNEPDKWFVVESEHFRHCVDKAEMKGWSERRLKEFQDRIPLMFNMAELIYHTYSERLALRSSVVSVLPEERGDGIKYKTPIQPSNGSWMGWDSHFGWACQGEGHINPHELAHGWSAMTGGMAGNFWEVFANWPQTYNGIYQTMPPGCVSHVCSCCPANGRDYYHDRLMFDHLAQTPEYGPMFIAKLWYDGPTATKKSPYPWAAFTEINPYPERTLPNEYTKMAMRNVTWDYVTFAEARGGKGNTPFGNDAVPSTENLYVKDANASKATISRYSRIILEKIPYEPDWWRVPKELAPQQLGWNICPLKFKPGRVSATLAGYVNPERGSDWRAGFVAVDAGGKPVYGEVFGPGKSQNFDVKGDIKDLFLVVCGTPSNIMAIDMVGDFRGFDQEPFPYKVKLDGCEPLNVLLPEKPTVLGAPHPNGGGFVASTAKVEASAYVGPNAQVLGNSVVSNRARIEDYAIVNDATVADEAMVCGFALVEDRSIVRGRARVRDFARVYQRSIVEGEAKLLEHAALTAGKTAKDFATLKGVASCYGNAAGTVMLDGFYAKGNEAVRGKWFTWSWGQGKNPGEVDEDFGGLYADYDFEKEHRWMAADAFGATWGYLVGEPKFEVVPARERKRDVPKKGLVREAGQVLVLNGRNQFVELPKDVADVRSCFYTAEFNWNGGENGARLFEFANATGDAVWLCPSENGKLVFAIRKGAKVEQLSAPAIPRGVWTTVQAVLDGKHAMLYVDGKKAAESDTMTLTPDSVRATQCYLGRGLKGGHLGGMVDRFTVHCVALVDRVPPAPDPAVLAMVPVFVTPNTLVVAATPGVDPLGNVEYFFEAEDGAWNSGWTNQNAIRLENQDAARPARYRVKMRDKCGNETAFSQPVQAAWVGPQAKVFDVAPAAPTVIEAEHWARNLPSPDGFKWELKTAPAGFVGGGAMQVLPDKGVSLEPPKLNAARLDYLVNFTKPGRHFVWLRALAPNPQADSIHIGLDMKNEPWGNNVGLGGKGFVWGGKREFHVAKPGVHTFSLWMREDGVTVDRLLFTTDGRYEPASDQRAPDKSLIGEGPAESPSHSL